MPALTNMGFGLSKVLGIICGEFGGVGFLEVCFLYKTNPDPRTLICRGKKWPKMPLLTCFFLGLGWPWVGEFVGFIIIFTSFMFSNPTELGNSQTPYCVTTSGITHYHPPPPEINIRTVFFFKPGGGTHNEFGGLYGMFRRMHRSRTRPLFFCSNTCESFR